MATRVLSFKDSEGGVTNVRDYSGKGASKGLKQSDGKEGKWYKLNEDAVTEGQIGTIVELDATLENLRKQLVNLKSLLASLKAQAQAVVGGTKCEWTATGYCNDGGVTINMNKECNVDKLYPPYVSQHIAVIEAEIAIVETTIEAIGQTRTLYNFMEHDNMHFLERMI